MKKILSFFAIAALMIGMASCNKDNETNLKRFKVSVENITATTADITITPPDEQTKYCFLYVTLGTFNALTSYAGGTDDMFKYTSATVATGTYEGDFEGLPPSNKLVLCISELNEDNEMVGEVEYLRFETKNVKPQMADFSGEGMTALPMTGKAGFTGDEMTTFYIKGSYPLDDESQLSLQLVYYAKEATGHFTTDDMITFFFCFSALYESDLNSSSIPLDNVKWVYASDVTGNYNAATDKYEYSGWCDVIIDNKYYRTPFTMECEMDKE